MRKKFEIYYCQNHPDKEKAGERYKPEKPDMLVMNSDGIFFVYSGETYYPSINTLANEIGNYDVKWLDDEQRKEKKE